MTFENKIRTLAIKYPISITSWGRSEKHNRMVGGAANSKHLVWLAVDVVLDDSGEAADFIRDAKILGLWTLDEGDHIHVQEA